MYNIYMHIYIHILCVYMYYIVYVLIFRYIVIYLFILIVYMYACMNNVCVKISFMATVKKKENKECHNNKVKCLFIAMSTSTNIN